MHNNLKTALTSLVVWLIFPFFQQAGVATMFIEVLKKRQGAKTYKSVLIRESYREDGKVKHRTIANITKLPAEHIRMLKKQHKGRKRRFQNHRPEKRIRL